MKIVSKNKNNIILIIISVAVIGVVAVVLFMLFRAPMSNQQVTPLDTAKGKVQPEEQVPREKRYELLIENEHYKIRREEGTDKYLVTLYAIINRPDQRDQYIDQLRQYKQEALQYLRNQGISIDRVTVAYEPEEAKEL